MEPRFETITVETDERSRVVLPGFSNSRFIMEKLPGGAILLEPAVTISTAQLEYLSTPELPELLTSAAAQRLCSVCVESAKLSDGFGCTP